MTQKLWYNARMIIVLVETTKNEFSTKIHMFVCFFGWILVKYWLDMCGTIVLTACSKIMFVFVINVIIIGFSLVFPSILLLSLLVEFS